MCSQGHESWTDCWRFTFWELSTKLEETDWAKMALGSEDVSTTGGDIKITIPDLEDDIYFLRIFADEDFQ